MRLRRKLYRLTAGLWFDELTVGQTFDHAICRTVTETDNLPVSTLTHNPAALHRDRQFGWDEVRCPTPVFIGDTLRIETEMADLREPKSRPNAGIVTFLHRGYTQHGTVVATCKRSGLQRKEPA